jgi:glycogen(starch) synthase
LNAHLRSIFYFVRRQKIERLPALLTLHDNFMFKQTGAIAAAVVEKVDAVVAISDSIRNDALAFDPNIEAILHTILNALPLPEVLPGPFPAFPRILAFGRAVADKGFDLAIRAFANVAGRFPGASLTIAGEGTDLMNLKSLAQSTGFAERIHFPGFVLPEKIHDFINQHSLVIVPSRWREPFGLVALDAALMGRPVIAANIGGLPEIVEDGVTGKLFESENVTALTAALQSFLESSELGEKLGRRARERALTRFDFGRFITAYENLYAKVCGTRV